MNANKETVNTDKETVNPNQESVNHNEETVNADQETVNTDKDTVKPNEESVNPDQESVNPNQESVNPDQETVNADQETVKPDEETVNGHEESEIVSVKTEPNDEENVKPNVQQLVLKGDSAVSDKSCELFSENDIKKEDSEEDGGHDESSISVKGRLSDEVTASSFAELVTAAENGKQEDVDVDVSLYTDSAEMLQADEKNTQYSGNIL